VGLTAHCLKSRLAFARAVCWPQIHLPKAWIGCWIGLLNFAPSVWRFAIIRLSGFCSWCLPLLELLVSILDTMACEAAFLGIEVNWQKTNVQALCCREDMPLTIKVDGQDVMVVEEFVYLGSLVHSSTGSTCDISRRSAITRAAMQSLENQIWRSRLAISTKLKLYNTCILPIFLYGSDCWAISKTDARKIDALDQWCLRMLLGIKWYQFVRNDNVRRPTKQPKLTAIIQSRRLSLFGHIMRMDDNTQMPRGSC